MSTTDPEPTIAWSEENSQSFIDYGRYFVPDREVQIETISALMPPAAQSGLILELCCGEGLLAAALLERYPACTVHGLDGSPRMLAQASANLTRYGQRFTTRLFDLAAHDWRIFDQPVHAVVSSLAIHHLDGAQKQTLFRDIHSMLAPGGAFVIADIIEPASPQGLAMAADAHDAAVRQRSLEIDGNAAMYEQFLQMEWNLYRYPDDMDKPSRLYDQLRWLEAAGFQAVDVCLMKAGHAIYGGQKAGNGRG